MLAEGMHPDAILTEIPRAAVSALRKAGVKPGEVAVAGWTTTSTPGAPVQGTIYTATCDFERLGRLGVETLMKRLEQLDKPVERRLISPTILDAEGRTVVSG